MQAELPLARLKVLAFEQYGAGPFGTQFLADLGAEVIKVGSPAEGGDMARSVGPYFLEPEDATNASLFFQAFNRNKKSITLDLSRSGAREVLEKLVARSDDVPARLGLAYTALSHANPRIVYAFLSAYSHEGSRAAWPGYDYLVQAEAGYFALIGEAGTPPSRMGLSIVDLMTGLGQAFALDSAVLKARETGRGTDIDTSLFDLACFNLSYASAWYLSPGHAQRRVPRYGHPSLTPCQLYRTHDDWIFLMCNKEKLWPILCEAIGRPEWASAPRFANFKARFAHRELIEPLLDEALSVRTMAEWLADFGGRVPAAPVFDVARALENPLLAERAAIQPVEHSVAGAFRLLANPIRVPAVEAPARAAPQLGTDTDALLDEIGYGDAVRARLRNVGIV